MKKIRVLIADDEPLAREGIRTQLQQDSEVEIAVECVNGRDAVQAIRNEMPDLVFLDVEMPLLDGFGVVETIGAGQMPVVIFVTAYDEYAIRAFEAHALDYVLKPVNNERLRKSLARAKRQIEQQRDHPVSQQLLSLLQELKIEQEAKQSHYPDRITIKARERIMFLDTKSIDWIESLDNYAKLHADGNCYTIRSTMSKLESKLNPARFLRIRRSTIINIGCIKELQPLFNGEYVIILNDGTRLQSSRRYHKNLDPLLQM
jgi:two-component system LytT family response regulator